jgi:hypothetical protein
MADDPLRSYLKHHPWRGISLPRMVKSLHRANIVGAASFQFASAPLCRGS